MFQSNAAKEVLYIFLWLIGIIFVYGLVHTFLLEPSNESVSSNHAKYAVTVESDKHKEKTATTSNHTQTNAGNTVSIPTVVVPVSVSKVPEVPKVAHTPAKKKIEVATPDHASSLASNMVHALTETTTSKTEINADSAAKKATLDKIEVTKTVALPKVVTPVANLSNDTHTAKQTKNKSIEDVAKVKSVETVSITPQKPSLVTVPSVPSVPTVPSVPNIKKVEDMKLLDTAKQHVKAASSEVINTLNK
jgi:hypothetical protein